LLRFQDSKHSDNDSITSLQRMCKSDMFSSESDKLRNQNNYANFHDRKDPWQPHTLFCSSSGYIYMCVRGSELRSRSAAKSCMLVGSGIGIGPFPKMLLPLELFHRNFPTRLHVFNFDLFLNLPVDTLSYL
jgi:hypothetical protein